MEKTINICDYCEKQTDDYYKKMGWIRLEGDFNITITKGRNITGSAETGFRKSYGLIEFCSEECFMAFLKKIR